MSASYPPPPPYPQQSMGPQVPSQGTNTLGLVALIVSIVSVVVCCGWLWPVSLVLALVGMRRQPKGMAVAALIVSLVSLLISLVSLAIFIPAFIQGFNQGRAGAYQSQCMENLSKIDGAKQQWALENNVDPESGIVPQWSDLVGENLYIRTSPVCPEGGVYTIGTIDGLPACSLSSKPDRPHVPPDLYGDYSDDSM